jgi:nucleotide-binding universal stress UspA family protein
VADLNDVLVQAVKDTGADLLVMATHLPHHIDAVLPSHGGEIATHTDISVFLVRPPADKR